MNDRYSRQQRFTPIGESGQARLEASSVLVCGCGALGSTIAERLARAGVGHLRIVDRDWVELSNLQRQALFTEEDARHSRPKAAAAAEALRRINSSIRIEPVVEDVTFQNIESLARGSDLILDGTDNFETRFLMNDFCVRYEIPWIHGGCLGANGQILSVIPQQTACFRCLVPELPSRDVLDSCDTAGVLGPAVGLVACWQAAEAMKVLTGNLQAVCRGLIVLDSWQTDARIVHLPRQEHCTTCVQANFEFLDGTIRTHSTVLCGKNAVQLEYSSMSGESLSRLAERLRALGQITENAFFVRLNVDAYQITIFRGGRTIVEGTTEPAEARTVVSRILGA